MGALRDLAAGVRQWKTFDDRRPSVPGEHWGALAAGMAAVGRARRARSPVARGALWLIGGLLLVRALSGRDGPLARARRRAG